MKKGFTLLELMIVIIILGVLATLGVLQYQSAIEKTRGAEARQILGQLRTQCAAIYMADGNTTNCSVGNLRIGTDTDMIPSACRVTHYFAYTAINQGGSTITFQSSRCTAGGKSPNSPTAGLGLQLAIDYATGSDTWTSVGGY